MVLLLTQYFGTQKLQYWDTWSGNKVCGIDLLYITHAYSNCTKVQEADCVISILLSIPSYGINYFLVSFSDYLEHSWNRLEYHNSISFSTTRKRWLKVVDAKQQWFHDAYDKVHVCVISKVNYRNGPKCFPYIGTVRTVNIYTNDRYHSLFPNSETVQSQNLIFTIELRHEETCLQGFRPGKTQTSMLRFRS